MAIRAKDNGFEVRGDGSPGRMTSEAVAEFACKAGNKRSNGTLCGSKDFSRDRKQWRPPRVCEVSKMANPNEPTR